MNFVRSDVATVALGFAASMGQFLLSSGAPGKRYALPNSSIVMHQPHGGFGGTSADIQTQAKQILHFKRRMAELTSEQTGKTVEQIIEDGDRDRWFTADEAREQVQAARRFRLPGGSGGQQYSVLHAGRQLLFRELRRRRRALRNQAEHLDAGELRDHLRQQFAFRHVEHTAESREDLRRRLLAAALDLREIGDADP